ncbi:uncharacterized protein N7482_006641 [Penicillium canariense]|uniref:Uncharacterized protein n=1 Tax=Penicillium canariense TaxID=189055 RepID=A0A9W9HVC5_9EURO|nr:uncharacterized protein N7482_006641 [Penicillium canariense]KAJ5159637.1 hypothetical protein N7482_006641 [Penicillium canariense]
MASSPYNNRLAGLNVQTNQDGWVYPWTPANTTAPALLMPGQSGSPTSRRAIPAPLPSTGVTSNDPMLHSPPYGPHPIPWGINASPILVPKTAASPPNEPWVSWDNASQCSPPSQGNPPPGLSFLSTGTLSQTTVDERTAVGGGGQDSHACCHTSYAEYVWVEETLDFSHSDCILDGLRPASSSADGQAVRTRELSPGKHAYGDTSNLRMSLPACSNAPTLNATKPSVGKTSTRVICDKPI